MVLVQQNLKAFAPLKGGDTLVYPGMIPFGKLDHQHLIVHLSTN